MTSDRCLTELGSPSTGAVVLAIAVASRAGACKGSTPAHGAGGTTGGRRATRRALRAAARRSRRHARSTAHGASCAPTPPAPRCRRFDDTAAPWSDVTLPHTWNALDGEDGGSNYYRGVGWYRRHLTAPADFAAGGGRQAFLQFDGANIVTDVVLERHAPRPAPRRLRRVSLRRHLGARGRRQRAGGQGRQQLGQRRAAAERRLHVLRRPLPRRALADDRCAARRRRGLRVVGRLHHTDRRLRRHAQRSRRACA